MNKTNIKFFYYLIMNYISLVWRNIYYEHLKVIVFIRYSITIMFTYAEDKYSYITYRFTPTKLI